MDDEDEAEVEDDAYERKPAWEDDDDITINIADVKRLRKLRNSESETVLSGAEYEARLRTQFERIYPPPKWSTLPEKKEQPSKIDLLKFLRSTRSIVARSKHAMLPSDQIDVTRMKDANQTAYSQAVIQTAVFHPKAPVLMTAGFDRTVRLFQVDGKINPKIQSIFFKDMPIHCASFTADGKQIILSGRRKFFYVYDIEKGSVEKVHSIYGREEKSLEKHYVSPCNRYLAFLGRDGYIVLVSNKSKQWIGNLKMNGTVKDLDFSSDGQYIFSIGGDGEVYQWELSSLSCIHRFVDDGAIRPSCISVSKDGSYMATGSGAGVVNVYSTASCLSSPTPKPLKTIMNLVTTIHSVRFHPSSQLLAISSRKKKDALKLVHLPSLNVFPNWPTSATPLSYVNAVSFSPGGGYIVMGNDKGKVLLYRLGAYDGY
ncbi:WD40-repeat-containing domain protein [Polychytrium aggregatum]|uniref:WD40-repeat-containing domain protein n=1 Tax=Polychytrium aggregatum TaxID=110093 RepID=UPI0022FF4007|nr:WD40-repeat-containing domain protein [Polychytrium aggregatum]KAI9208833.1 WD40-repeat-containing domain protein [Polychytrium aggregatum]